MSVLVVFIVAGSMPDGRAAVLSKQQLIAGLADRREQYATMMARYRFIERGGTEVRQITFARDGRKRFLELRMDNRASAQFAVTSQLR